MKKWVLLFFIITIPVFADSKFPVLASFNISYFGELGTHPGIKEGLEWNLLSHKNHALMLESNIGFFYHPRNTVAFFIYPDISYQYTFNFRMILSIHIGLG